MRVLLSVIVVVLAIGGWCYTTAADTATPLLHEPLSAIDLVPTPTYVPEPTATP